MSDRNEANVQRSEDATLNGAANAVSKGKSTVFLPSAVDI